MSQSTPITVLLADDQPLFRSGVRRLLAASPDLQIIGESGELGQVIHLVEQFHPAILLLNIRLLGPQGLENLSTWHARSPRTKILLLTDRDDEVTIPEALQYGAYGIVPKQLPSHALRKALRVVYAGELWAPPKVVAHVLETLRHRLAGATERPAAPQAHLTAREREVIQGVQKGLTNQEIAAQLGISAKTVKAHLHVLFQKLGIQRRQQLRRLPLSS
jgi:DNA-binding NarL/FixJ family response regulator